MPVKSVCSTSELCGLLSHTVVLLNIKSLWWYISSHSDCSVKHLQPKILFGFWAFLQILATTLGINVLAPGLAWKLPFCYYPLTSPPFWKRLWKMLSSVTATGNANHIPVCGSDPLSFQLLPLTREERKADLFPPKSIGGNGCLNLGTTFVRFKIVSRQRVWPLEWALEGKWQGTTHL